MTSSRIGDEHYFALEHAGPSENAAAVVGLSTSEHRGDPASSSLHQALRRDSCGVGISVRTIQEMSRTFEEPPAALSRAELDSHLHLGYKARDKNAHRQVGSNRFMAYLDKKQKSLAEVTKGDLEEWSLTPMVDGRGKGKLPDQRAFEGAKALCAFAAEVRAIDAQRARELAACMRPRYRVHELRATLQNSLLTREQREHHIHLSYQSTEKDAHRQAGANGILAYLATQGKSLAEVTPNDLEQWALTTITTGPRKGSLPTALAFEGAKALCVLAAEAGHISGHGAQDFAECTRQHGDVGALRLVLQNPALTHKEREEHLRLDFQSRVNNRKLQTGARGILAYLENQAKSLAEVTPRDLEQWALTIITTGTNKGSVPNGLAFDGAKALCALAAEVGYIDAHRAEAIAECTRPRYDVNVLRTVLQNPELEPEEREYQIHLNYKSAEKDLHRQAGASSILAYLANQEKSLAEVSKSDLEKWSLTATAQGSGKGYLPSALAFEGAKALCLLAAEAGHLNPQSAKAIAECSRPHIAVNELRIMLQNPAITPKECEDHLRFSYQSREKDRHRLAGAKGFLTHLESQNKELAKVTKSDLERWALTPISFGSRTLPTALAFEGAKALCALAAEVGYIDAQRAIALAQCPRPLLIVDSLRRELQNPALTRKDREYHMRLNFQKLESDRNRQAGATGFWAYLESQARPLAEVTKHDLEEWALAPIGKGKGKGNLPNTSAFAGAKALCALAAEVGYIDAQVAQDIATCPRPQIGLDALRRVLQNPALSRKEREYHIRLNYQSMEKKIQYQAGARDFLAYLVRQEKPLADVSTRDLKEWALTPTTTGQGHLPKASAFEGAKALCVLAGEVGHINAQSAKALAECTRPKFDRDFLRSVLENPALTHKECEYHIRLNYQSAENNPYRLAGADGILAFLESRDSSLAEVTKSDLEEWALTPRATGSGVGNLPNASAFEGAKALCVLAGEVGYIDAQTAKALAECTRPKFELDFLRSVLENPGLTSKECQYQISLNYQSTEKNVLRQAGARGILAFLESQGLSLAEATTSHLHQWALTPMPFGSGKRTFPSAQAFEGAKALCLLATQVGHIDPQRAPDFATCLRPMQAGANKRLRTDDQGASTSASHSFALPQSDAFFRDLALSPPTLLDPDQPTRSAQVISTESLIDELESLEDMLGSGGQLY